MSQILAPFVTFSKNIKKGPGFRGFCKKHACVAATRQHHQGHIDVTRLPVPSCNALQRVNTTHAKRPNVREQKRHSYLPHTHVCWQRQTDIEHINATVSGNAVTLSQVFSQGFLASATHMCVRTAANQQQTNQGHIFGVS